jgi:AcrR family transcriptional regulator
MAPSDRYAQLLRVAEELFVTRGFAAVSMEDIARAAGVTRPVVYDHFQTKERAYLACVERARAAYEAELLQQVDPHASPREQLRAGAEGHFAMLERDPARWRLLFGSSAVLPGEASSELAALRFSTIEQIRRLMAAAAPAAPPERIEACAQVVDGAAERLGHWWITRPDISRATLVEHFLDILWDGLHPYVTDDQQLPNTS